jgi:TPP-dependent pyruvate/acetoin dehydrogenase alpha subunit
MPGVPVDGTDLGAVHEAMQRALTRARRGDGPTLIEAAVVRLVAHSNADDQTAYRTEEELAAARRRDPLPIARARLLASGASEVQIAEWEGAAKERAEAALAAAEVAPDPEASEARAHLYKESA